MNLRQAEKEKYEKCWNLSDYRTNSPGERRLEDVEGDIPLGAKVIDYGTGTGRAALSLHENGYTVVMVDLAENCLDPKVKQSLNGNFRFVEACLWEPLFINGDYAYCTDVLEHIPTEFVDDVLKNITACPRGYLNISTVDDYFGSVVGEPLHLTVKPWDWWVDKVNQFATVEKVRVNPSSVSIWYK